MKYKSIREQDIEAIIRRMNYNKILIMSRREAKKFKLTLKKMNIPFSTTFTKHGILFEIK